MKLENRIYRLVCRYPDRTERFYAHRLKEIGAREVHAGLLALVDAGRLFREKRWSPYPKMRVWHYISSAQVQP